MWVTNSYHLFKHHRSDYRYILWWGTMNRIFKPCASLWFDFLDRRGKFSISETKYVDIYYGQLEYWRKIFQWCIALLADWRRCKELLIRCSRNELLITPPQKYSKDFHYHRTFFDSDASWKHFYHSYRNSFCRMMLKPMPLLKNKNHLLFPSLTRSLPPIMYLREIKIKNISAHISGTASSIMFGCLPNSRDLSSEMKNGIGIPPSSL